MTTNEKQNENDHRTDAAKVTMRQVTDDRLDRLYMKSMRCPYCHTKIAKGVAACPNCGISKEQIYHANLVVNKRKKKGEPRVKQPKPQIIMSKVRPASIPFWKMAIGAVFGVFGVHCFIAKRWKRGLLILGCFVLFFILSICIFQPGLVDGGVTVVPMHPWRAAFENKTYLFPPDLLGIVAMGMWIWDWICILFGTFKYPVVLAADADVATDESVTKGNA